MLFRRTQDRTFIPWITSAIWVSLPIMGNLRLIIAMSVSLLASGCQTTRVSTARTTESLAIQHREIMDWFAGEHFRRSGYNALKHHRITTKPTAVFAAIILLNFGTGWCKVNVLEVREVSHFIGSCTLLGRKRLQHSQLYSGEYARIRTKD